VNVTFAAAGHPTLEQTARVSFLQTAKRKKQRPSAKKESR
jgi:hypothetical protein